MKYKPTNCAIAQKLHVMKQTISWKSKENKLCYRTIIKGSKLNLKNFMGPNNVISMVLLLLLDRRYNSM
jgi:hypothetical protein